MPEAEGEHQRCVAGTQVSIGHPGSGECPAPAERHLALRARGCPPLRWSRSCRARHRRSAWQPRGRRRTHRDRSWFPYFPETWFMEQSCVFDLQLLDHPMVALAEQPGLSFQPFPVRRAVNADYEPVLPRRCVRLAGSAGGDRAPAHRRPTSESGNARPPAAPPGWLPACLRFPVIGRPRPTARLAAQLPAKATQPGSAHPGRSMWRQRSLRAAPVDRSGPRPAGARGPRPARPPLLRRGIRRSRVGARSPA